MSNKPNSNIPSLGNTSDEILKSALNYNCAGFILKFKIVGEGEWHFNPNSNTFERIVWRGNIPLIDKIESGNFDEWLVGQVRKGFVGIFVESTGRNPHYSKELHRARGIPLTA